MRNRRPKKFYSPEILARQIKRVMEQFGIKDQQEFNALIGVQQAVTRWKAGDTTPSADSLLAIKKTFNVSIDELLTGEAPAPPMLRENHWQDYQSQTPAEIDTAKLARIAVEAETFLAQNRLKIAPARKKAWLTLLFEYWFTERKLPDEDVFKSLLTLTAAVVSQEEK